VGVLRAAQKLALTSLYLLLQQVSERGSQLAFLFMAFALVWVLKTMLPYRDWKDHVLAEGSLLLTFLLGCVPYPDLSADAAGGLVLAIAVAEAALFVLVAGLQLRDRSARKRRGIVADQGRDGGSEDAADAKDANAVNAATRRSADTGAKSHADEDDAARPSLVDSLSVASHRV
jgi:hypothetical protein